MNCLNCGVELIQSGTKPRQYCDNACRMARKRTEERKRTDEDNLRKASMLVKETPNCRSAREYREFQKKWIKGACEEFEEKESGKCKCGKPYLRHHEARYRVYHSELL